MTCDDDLQAMGESIGRLFLDPPPLGVMMEPLTDPCPHAIPRHAWYPEAHAIAERRLRNGETQRYCIACQRWRWKEGWTACPNASAQRRVRQRPWVCRPHRRISLDYARMGWWWYAHATTPLPMPLRDFVRLRFRLEALIVCQRRNAKHRWAWQMQRIAEREEE